jgi:hypothetical protein
VTLISPFLSFPYGEARRERFLYPHPLKQQASLASSGFRSGSKLHPFSFVSMGFIVKLLDNSGWALEKRL